MKTIMLFPLIMITLMTSAHSETDPDLPPAAYDHAFPGEIVLTELSTEPRVRKICQAFGADILPGGTVLACGFAIRGKCFIFTLSDADLKAYGHEPRNVMRHERAHCNGWIHEPRVQPRIEFPK